MITTYLLLVEVYLFGYFLLFLSGASILYILEIFCLGGCQFVVKKVERLVSKITSSVSKRMLIYPH